MSEGEADIDDFLFEEVVASFGDVVDIVMFKNCHQFSFWRGDGYGFF